MSRHVFLKSLFAPIALLSLAEMTSMGVAMASPKDDVMVCAGQLRMVQLIEGGTFGYLELGVFRSQTPGKAHVEARVYPEITPAFSDGRFLAENGDWPDEFERKGRGKIQRLYGEGAAPIFVKSIDADVSVEKTGRDDAVFALTSPAAPGFRLEFTFQDGKLVPLMTREKRAASVLSMAELRGLGFLMQGGAQIPVPTPLDDAPSASGQAPSKERILLTCGELGSSRTLKQMKSWGLIRN